jgi:hypothetical protein
MTKLTPRLPMARPMLMTDVRTEMHGGKNADGAVPADGAVLVLLAQ